MIARLCRWLYMRWQLWRWRWFTAKKTAEVIREDHFNKCAEHPAWRYLGSPAFARQCYKCGHIEYFENMPDGVFHYTEAIRQGQPLPAPPSTSRYGTVCGGCGRGVANEFRTMKDLAGNIIGCPYCGSQSIVSAELKGGTDV